MAWLPLTVRTIIGRSRCQAVARASIISVIAVDHRVPTSTHSGSVPPRRMV